MRPADVSRRRLRLRPGLGVVRRDDARLQVGVDEPLRLLLDDSPEVRRVLRELLGGATERAVVDVSSPESSPLRALIGAGLVVAADDAGSAPVLAAQRGDEAAARATARRAAAVRLVDVGACPPGAAKPPSGELARLLRESGVGLEPPAVPGTDPTLVVVVAAGVLPRERLDDLVRDGRPHLVVELGPRRCRVGPLVEPGLTACLRCVDAHEADTDPGRPLVLAQVADLALETYLDPVLSVAALAWAARDVVRLVDGDEPFSRSAVASFDLDAPAATVRPHLRHPWCGCSWDVAPG